MSLVREDRTQDREGSKARVERDMQERHHRLDSNPDRPRKVLASLGTQARPLGYIDTPPCVEIQHLFFYCLLEES